MRYVMKRRLSLLLAFVMVFSMSFEAFAESETVEETAVEVLEETEDEPEAETEEKIAADAEIEAESEVETAEEVEIESETQEEIVSEEEPDLEEETVSEEEIVTEEAANNSVKSATINGVEVNLCMLSDANGTYRLEYEGSGIITSEMASGFLNGTDVSSNQVIELKIGSGITEIEDYVFSDYQYLQQVTTESPNLSYENHSFPFSVKGDPLLVNGVMVGRDWSNSVLTIGSDVCGLSSRICYGWYESYILASDNPYFTIYQDALFSKDLTIMYGYPLSSESTKFTIPDQTTTILARFGFRSDTQSPLPLKELHIGAGITDLTAFSYDDRPNASQITRLRLDKITVSSDNPVFKSNKAQNCLYSKDGKILYYVCANTEPVFSSSVTNIAYSALAGNTTLGKVSLPKTVVSIGIQAFAGSSITEVDLGSVQQICVGAFSACAGLKKISIPAECTYIDNDALPYVSGLNIYFRGSSSPAYFSAYALGYTSTSYSNITIWYPAGASDSYGSIRNLNNWKECTWKEIGDLAGSKCTITLSSTSTTYNGKAKTPTPTVTFDGVKLTKDVDYTVSYKNNTLPGTGYVIITGINGYSGTVKKSFTIKKLTQTVIVTSSYEKTYGCSAFTVKASTNGDGTLKYSSSNTGIATVSSTGKVTVVKPGTVKIYVYATEGDLYKASDKVYSKIVIGKKANPMTFVDVVSTVAYSTKKNRTFDIKVSKAKGAVTYVSADKTWVTVSSTGTVTVKKGAPKGKYKIAVKAAGNDYYEAVKLYYYFTVK